MSSGVSVSVATVNQYAMKGLDKMEEKLPILHQPADQVTQKHRTFVTGTFIQQLELTLDRQGLFFSEKSPAVHITRKQHCSTIDKYTQTHIAETLKTAHLTTLFHK